MRADFLSWLRMLNIYKHAAYTEMKDVFLLLNQTLVQPALGSVLVNSLSQCCEKVCDNYIHSSVRVCCQVSPLTLVALVSGSAHASNEYIHIASFLQMSVTCIN